MPVEAAGSLPGDAGRLFGQFVTVKAAVGVVTTTEVVTFLPQNLAFYVLIIVRHANLVYFLNLLLGTIYHVHHSSELSVLVRGDHLTVTHFLLHSKYTVVV